MWIFAGCSFALLLTVVLLTARADYAIGNFSLLLLSPFLLGGWCLGVWLISDAARSLRKKRWLIASSGQLAVGCALLVLIVWFMGKWR
jgi:hypothetical protein